MTPAAPTLHRARRPLAVLLTVAWVGAFVLTHIPKLKLPEEVHVGDKTLHAVGYAVLAALFLLTRAAYGSSPWRRAILVAVSLAAYGAFDEITQPLVNRTAAMGDWLADLGGAIGAIVAVEILMAITQGRRKGRAGYAP